MGEKNSLPDRAPGRPQRENPRTFRARVERVLDITPHLRRVTFAAPEFTDFVRLGFDEYLGLIIPKTPSAPLVLPSTDAVNIRAAVNDIPERVRPDLRWYSVRNHRSDCGEIDVDFVVHGDEGPGTRFASRASAGDIIAIREGTALYNPTLAGGARLFIADESSQPALAAILENTLDDGPAYVFVETTSRRDVIDYPVAVEWVERGKAPGIRTEERLRSALFTEEIDYAWLCAESGMVQRLRRYLVSERHIARNRITFSGYWRLGEPRL